MINKSNLYFFRIICFLFTVCIVIMLDTTPKNRVFASQSSEIVMEVSTNRVLYGKKNIWQVRLRF